ncbi:MAG: hypothetical protein OEV49_15420 [candidate division Zixibacteria bacterium]|nr:hypothetical protein [candidate division Zixibacteria bacterium]MDH3939115.1 hypothetical protein [candidate division Zixibacteria bacterium]MDH4035142.1 hypothetical protein [candidate division Zixibacteria bacterium]
MPWKDKSIVMGFYQGIGDFLSAIPVANELLRQGNRVSMVVSRTNLELAELVAWENEHIKLIEFAPFSSKPGAGFALMRDLIRLKADYVVVSPHAQKRVSSWKLPVLLWMVKHLARPRLKVVGSADERLSGLYDQRMTVDKQLDLTSRERVLHQAAGSVRDNCLLNMNIFTITRSPSNGETTYDLVIHPGASRDIKMWPIALHRELIESLDTDLRIAFLGVPAELSPIEDALGQRANVAYLSGSVTDAVRVVARAPVVLTMDSGFSHVAAFLGVRHFALFGSTDPSAYPPRPDRSTMLYRQVLPCQPCNLHTCPFDHAVCMQQVGPAEVAEAIIAALDMLGIGHVAAHPD